ncbi:P-loop NTPase fold protein [Providencia vermicola]|uniref:P-loop NTPase fold protein n=1 Tax=Providencia vermicola TaxID=333965 RepID=UPI001CEC4468|nr:P-loop NTPase fold protein [Providencia vermicola]
MKNELVIEQLNERLANFCNSDSSNDHVLLLNGEWGIGKSYFIKNFFSKKNSSYNHHIISLFGITSLSALDEAIKTKLTYKHENDLIKIHKLILNMALDAGVETIGVPPTLISYIKEYKIKYSDKKDRLIYEEKMKDKKTIIILDDLERSNIDYKILLGYINNIAISFDCKTICICNDIIINNNNNSEDYINFKEKVFFRELKMPSQTEHAFDSIISEYKPEWKTKFNKNKKIILESFKHTGSNNLRTLRFILNELKYYITSIGNSFFNNEGFFKEFTTIFSILFVHYKEKRDTIELLLGTDAQSNEKNSLQNLFIKANINYNNLIIPKNYWIDIIQGNAVNFKNLKNEIQSSSYFYKDRNKDKPWFELSHIENVNKETFNILINKSLDLLEKETNLGDLFTNIDSLSFFQAHNALPPSIFNLDTFKEKAKTKIKELSKQQKENILENRARKIYLKNIKLKNGENELLIEMFEFLSNHISNENRTLESTIEDKIKKLFKEYKFKEINSFKNSELSLVKDEILNTIEKKEIYEILRIDVELLCEFIILLRSRTYNSVFEIRKNENNSIERIVKTIQSIIKDEKEISNFEKLKVKTVLENHLFTFL